jgi:hypothetical protein
MAKEFVEADLHLKGRVTVLAVDLAISLGDERNLLVRGLGAENIAERDVLESIVLANVIIVGLSG